MLRNLGVRLGREGLLTAVTVGAARPVRLGLRNVARLVSKDALGGCE